MAKAKNAIQELITSNLQSSSQMSEAMRNMGVEPKVMRRVAPLDDNVDPETPKNVEVTSFLKALGVEWDAPPQKDAVAEVEIEVTPSAGAPFVQKVKGSALSYVFYNLAYNNHSFRVRFIDKFNRISAWSLSVSGAPSRSAQYEIDLTEARILGNLKGLLPNANLATIQDATKLGSGVVLAEAMAVQNAAALNLWVGNGAIQRAMIGNAQIDTAQIEQLAVTTGKIADLAVTNAKVDSIIANKIVTSTLSATVITLGTGGKLQSAGAGVILSDAGLQLDFETVLGNPSENVDRKITAKGGYASLSFYSQNPPNSRGVYIRADGIAGTGKVGGIYLHTTPNGVGSAGAAATIDVNSLDAGNIILTASVIQLRGGVDIWNNNLTFVNDAALIAFNTLPLTTIGAGNTLTTSHSISGVPKWFIYQHTRAGIGWINTVNGVNSVQSQLYSDRAVITNNGTDSMTVRGYLNR